MFDSEDSKIKEIGGLFIFIILAAITSWICIYFEIKEALFAFITSLFFIYVIPGSRYSSFKNIIGSYVIASLTAYLSLKFLSVLFINLNPVIAEILLIMAVLFASGFLMVLFGMEHPPAIAIALFWLFAELASKKIVGLAICFAIIVVISLIAQRIRGKKGGLDAGLGGDLGKDFGGDFGKDLGGNLGKGLGSDKKI